MAAKKRFKILFNKEKCKGCEICISFCPKKIIQLTSEVNSKGFHPADVAEQEECIGCLSCATMCPDCCISIYELEEGEA